MSHTPTPWTWNERLERIEANDEKILLVGVSLPCGNHPKDKEAQANAAHIVRCVNVHDQLVEALRDAHKALASIANSYDYPGLKYLPSIQQYAQAESDATKQALAAAEKGA